MTIASTTRPPTVPCTRDDLIGLHSILPSYLDESSGAQRQIVLESYLEGQPRDEIAGRCGISLITYDNRRKTACRKLRDSITAVVDSSTDVDVPDWHDRIAEMNERHAASQRRRASSKRAKRSSSGGDPSNFEGDRSNARSDAEKNGRARDDSVGVTTKP